MRYHYKQAVWVWIVLSAGAGLGWCEPRVLLVGDSWAERMWDQSSFQFALESAGFSEIEVMGMNTAVSGSTAQQWANDPAMLELITTELNRHPSIDIVQLFIGGNDVLFSLFEDLDLMRLIRALPVMVGDIDRIANHILEQRPNIRLLLAEYDYLPFESLFIITAGDINNLLIEAARLRLDLTQQKERMFYLSNLGLMQHSFGLPGEASPGELPPPGDPPDHEPLAGGNPTRPSPGSAFEDPIHLTPEGYRVLAERIVRVFWNEWLLNPLQNTPIRNWELY